MAREIGFWKKVGDTLTPVFTGGVNLLIKGTNKYLNFNSLTGDSGYGIRDNNGTIEVKSSGGSWSAISTGGGEANTAANLGTGEGVFGSKVGVELRFKSLVAGTGVTLSSDGSEITINSTGGHDPVTVTDSAEINFTLTGQDLTASLIAGSIDETKLDTSVNASLDLADSAQQPPAEGAFVDGDKTKLDGIETGADVTDTANVSAAGALMDSEVTNLADVKAFDPADYAAASHTHAAGEVTSGTFADARIAESNVTQHQTALSITESQISDLGTYPDITSGAGAPLSTPTKEGDIYVDTTNDTYYVAVGTASSADWEANGSGSGSPGGSDTQVQFNDGGSFGGQADFTYDKTAKQLALTGTNDILYIEQDTNGVGTRFVNTNINSTGAGIAGYGDKGAAAGTDDRLGFFLFGGAYNATNDLRNSVLVGGYATENWSDTQSGSKYGIEVTTNGTNDRNIVAEFDEGGVRTVGAYSTLSGQNSILRTNSENSQITITDGANGNINLQPDGTGEAQVNGQKIIDETEVSGAFVGTTDTQTLSNKTFIGTTAVERLDYDQSVGTVSAIGNLGATETFDWSAATHFTGTLDANTTLDFSNAVSGQKITLALAYDATAQRTITWTPTIKWAGGSAPDAPSTSGEELVITVAYLGTTYYASYETFS